jgi:hypothetical protein
MTAWKENSLKTDIWKAAKLLLAQLFNFSKIASPRLSISYSISHFPPGTQAL